MAALPWDFTWCNFKWLTFAFRFLDWATFLKILKIIYYSSILYGRPRPPCQNNKSFQPILTAVHKASQKQIGPITTQEHRLWLVCEITLSNITFFFLCRSLIQRNYFACLPGPCWLYWCKHFKGELMFSVYFSFTLLSIPKWLLFLGILLDAISNGSHSRFVFSIGLLFSKFWRSFITLQYCINI